MGYPYTHVALPLLPLLFTQRESPSSKDFAKHIMNQQVKQARTQDYTANWRMPNHARNRKQSPYRYQRALTCSVAGTNRICKIVPLNESNKKRCRSVMLNERPHPLLSPTTQHLMSPINHHHHPRFHYHRQPVRRQSPSPNKSAPPELPRTRTNTWAYTRAIPVTWTASEV